MTQKGKFSPRELRVEEWTKKAEDDELNARSILKHRDGTPSAACFLSHQMAEKYYKAFLVSTKNWFPRIHPLGTLNELCEESESSFAALKSAAIDLDPYYTPARYPADFPDFSWHDAEQAFAAATHIKEFVLKKLAIPKRKPRKKL